MPFAVCLFPVVNDALQKKVVFKVRLSGPRVSKVHVCYGYG